MEQQGYRLCIINHSKQTDHVEYLIRLVSMEDNSLSIQFLEKLTVMMKALILLQEKSQYLISILMKM